MVISFLSIVIVEEPGKTMSLFDFHNDHIIKYHIIEKPHLILDLPSHGQNTRKKVTRSLQRTKHNPNHLKLIYQTDTSRSQIINKWKIDSNNPVLIVHKTSSRVTNFLRMSKFSLVWTLSLRSF